ncbi:MAG: hypothetical protein D6706_10005 [Chloroflexi bacterium]|nr:MAG: hypothetical protein D6706_10005 [Chloroflexota bacterium]
MNDKLALAKRLAAYLPETVTRYLLTTGLPAPGDTVQLTAATLFADISGFTAMSEELATDGPRGAEEVNRVLLVTFTGMIDIIHEMGGAVSHFYGDAMQAYFPDWDGQAALRALVCAQMMQQLMGVSFNRVVTNRPAGKENAFLLTMKVGVGYGRCQEIIVGQPGEVMEFVLTGTAVDEAAIAEHHAHAGQIIASHTALQQAGLPAIADYAPLTTPLAPVPTTPLIDWETADAMTLDNLIEAAASFIPPSIYQRLLSGNTMGMADHRPVTTLFVQFTLADSTEKEAGHYLQAYYQWARHLIARFGAENAHLNRVLTGDKGNQLHIIFGAPVAPDTPEQAILCALALQRERPDFVTTQQIGMAVGKVFAGPVGSEARREYTVVGDVVNLSARLAQMCPDGMVWTDALTAERVAETIEFRQLPPVHLKGKQQAIVPYQPRREQLATQVQAFLDRWERPFVGRSAELDTLFGGMDLALRGIGGMAVIVGPTGVGKSRLVAEGMRYWLDAHGMVLLGVCYPHTTDVPLSPWQNVWAGLFDLRPDMGVEAQVTAVIQQTRELVPDVGEDIGLWAEVLGLPFPQSEALLQMTAEARQARLFGLMRRCLLAMAQKRPLLIVLENVHWADQASIRLVDTLTNRMDDWPLYFLLTTRPPFSLTLAALETADVIHLTDLQPADARRYLQQVLGTAELPPAIEQQLGLRDRDGRDSPVNPLFLEEALKVLVENGVLETNGRLHINQELLQNTHIPDTIHGILLARLDRLPPTNRDLLQVASIVGRQFLLESITQLLPHIPPYVQREIFQELTYEEVLRLVASEPDWTYLFRHAMMHEVVYESLPYARRQALHEVVANWLEKRYTDNLKPIYPLLAYHYSQANNHEKGLKYALLAAESAAGIFANNEAIEMYNLAERHLQALGEAAAWETAVTLHLNRGHIHRLLGNFDAVLQDAQKALALSRQHNHPAYIARACNLMADAKIRQAQYDEVDAYTAVIIEQLGQQSPPDELAHAYLLRGWTYSAQLDYDRALDNLQQARQITQQTGNQARLADVLEVMGFAYYSRQQFEQALTAMKRSVALRRIYSTPVNVGMALNNLAIFEFFSGFPQEAVPLLEEAMEIGRQTSDSLLVLALVNHGYVHTYLGNFDQARTSLEEAIALLRTMDDMYVLIEAHLIWGMEYYRAIGDMAQARRHLSQAWELIDLQPENYPEELLRCHIGLALVAWHDADWATMGQHVRDAYRLAHEKGLTWWISAVFWLQGALYRHKGKLEKAIEQCEQGLAAMEEGASPDYRPLLWLELARCATTDDQKYHSLVQVVTSARERARFVDQIYCLQEAGNMLIAAPKTEWRKLGKEALQQAETRQKEKTDIIHPR